MAADEAGTGGLTHGGPAPEIGAFLRWRPAEISDRIVERWLRGSKAAPGASARIEAGIRKATEAGTLAVADYLLTGEIVSRQRSEAWDSTGEAPLLSTVTLSEVTRLYLYWRDACLSAVREEASRCGWAPDLVETAVGAVQLGCDASLVRMAERFEATREELEAQLAENQARLEHQALHDPLTGLANRALLLDRLDHVLRALPRHGTPPVVLFMDLDHFKSVNDAGGHSAGDQVLVELAFRLLQVLRPTDTVARLGGDEFIVLCEDVLHPTPEGLSVAQRIVSVLAEPFLVGGREIFVAASLGIATGDPADDAEALLARADQAMYRAKQLGRGRVEVYDPEMDEQASRRAELTTSLHHALDRRQLHVVYQPVIDLVDHRLSAREALLRWHVPGLGEIPPDEFIPIAEQTGLITQIGRWVMGKACRDCAGWQAAGDPGVGVTVNVSGRQLEDAAFVDDVTGALVQTGLEPTSLTLEITETRLMAGRPESRTMLRTLRSLGVRIAVDDFGTGHSSLSWLARLPLDVLKVDRSFVAGIGTVDRESAIVQAMIHLAHTLGLSVVGEGVETAEQLARLTDLGCDQAQGYFLGYPEPLAQPVTAAPIDAGALSD